MLCVLVRSICSALSVFLLNFFLVSLIFFCFTQILRTCFLFDIKQASKQKRARSCIQCDNMINFNTLATKSCKHTIHKEKINKNSSIMKLISIFQVLNSIDSFTLCFFFINECVKNVAKMKQNKKRRKIKTYRI